MLSEQQFAEQLALPDMPKAMTRLPVLGDTQSPYEKRRQGYTNAWDTRPDSPWKGTQVIDNPLPRTEDKHARDESDLERMGHEEFRWVPSYNITSSQEGINPRAVEHQVKNANPLALDEDVRLTSYESRHDGEHFDVFDGNHRVNAALSRGQMLMPAMVRKELVPEEWKSEEEQLRNLGIQF